MKYLLGFVLLLLVAPALSSITNTTEFFGKALGMSLSYQAYSGYEDIDWYFGKGTAAIYYSLWQNAKAPFSDKSVPLIIWLQGGPGGPSQFGCFNEIGPLFINGKAGSTKPIETSWPWTSYGHLLCPDQPIGVGFSFNNNSNKVNNTRDAARHFVNFLTNFFNNNPSFSLKENPLYIAGQSYAGHYIPAIAELILSNTTFKLKGILLGDGWVDPIYQANNYDSYLSSAGITSMEGRDTIAFMQNEAMTRIIDGNFKEASNYINFIIANDGTAAKYYNGMNVLNYKQYDEGNINPDYASFLSENKASFGVPAWMKYVDDNQEMYYAFDEDLSRSYKGSLQILLQKGIKTLIYNGQNDFIVNTACVLTYMNTLTWQYAQNWRAQTKVLWKESGGKNLGWYKNYRNLIFVLVRDAGHLLPSDQPRSAWMMLRNYFSGTIW